MLSLLAVPVSSTAPEAGHFIHSDQVHQPERLAQSVAAAEKTAAPTNPSKISILY